MKNYSDINKQAEEVIFSQKIKSNIYPLLVFIFNFVSQALTLKNILELP